MHGAGATFINGWSGWRCVNQGVLGEDKRIVQYVGHETLWLFSDGNGIYEAAVIRSILNLTNFPLK